MYKLCKFQVNILFVTYFMNLQSSKSGCVNYARFRKSGHIYVLSHNSLPSTIQPLLCLVALKSFFVNKATLLIGPVILVLKKLR